MLCSICKGHFLNTHTLHVSSFSLTLRLKPTLKYLHCKNQSKNSFSRSHKSQIPVWPETRPLKFRGTPLAAKDDRLELCVCLFTTNFPEAWC